MSHFKKICKVCNRVIAQCRCMSCDKTIEYDVCDRCRESEYSGENENRRVEIK